MGTDFLAAVIEEFDFDAGVFFDGEFCGMTHFQDRQGIGHIRLICNGSVNFEHAGEDALVIQGPALVFYPRPLAHRLVVQEETLSNLICADITFRNRDNNLIASALPDYIVIQAEQSGGIGDVTDLLFRKSAISESRPQFVLDRLCEILIYKMICYVIDQNSVSTGLLAGMADKGIRQALAEIHREPDLPWSVDTLAAHASMSRTKFATRFCELVGTSPGRYLTDWRLTIAEGLLLRGELVKSVAEVVGFGTQPSFTKAFIDRNRLSPKQWVKNITYKKNLD